MKKISLSVCAVLFSCMGFAHAHDVSAEGIADAFYKLNGKDPKMKINHTKGFCTKGVFLSSQEARDSLDVPLLNQKEIPAFVRYSLGGVEMDDRSKGRGMALQLEGKGGTWTMVMTNAEILFAKNPEEFIQFLAMRTPKNGKVDEERVKKLSQEVASYRRFDAYMKNVGITPSVANTPYYSVHTFMFKDKKTGKMLPAKWKFVPVDGVRYLSNQDLKEKKSDYLLTAFQEHVKTKPIEYKMYLVFANKNDAINDTTALWKGKHRELYAGTLKIEQYEGMGCNKDVYFPSDLPTGVRPPNDPLFQIRNEVYGITFGRRQ
ncbi:catalase family peroxidase [Helicobacter mustelae]|uniref:Catalase-related peroxidase n=1 Tax=Helicobacter mustelae (strain ATCC 43772 / CCUG 25715 / CIP 103759 / LMG 18044 / NCTC 12198 / R85-136P) TaxID=679897 RepID=D3UIF3_HELM1|nr:catalase family peroxidase [Helicobacter mustelae]CBG40276.1 putative catalase [Helicobacter mustelae 12198]SQH71776.1 catalase [Helicobacter mustelae]